MIEGANSTQVNQETKSQLSNIDKKLETVTNKLADLKTKKQNIRDAVPILYSALQEIEKTSTSGGDAINKQIKQNLENLKNYIDEDIDD